MSLALLVVTAVRIEGRSKSEVARDYGISRRWVIELVKRFDAEGEAGLEPRSRRPVHVPGRTCAQIEERIVCLREELTAAGLDAGAHTIAFHLSKEGLDTPSVAAIWRVLSRRGLIIPQPQKRPKSSYVRFQADLPNERWQADITHVDLSLGSPVEVFNVIDDHSRLVLASVARPSFKVADLVETFHQAALAHGFPASMLTDNAAVFTAGPRGNGRCAFEVELAGLGVRLHHSRLYHPQTCGKVERFHQTLKKWLAAQSPVATIQELQVQLDSFCSYYNQIRPHRSLGKRTPAEAFAARPKAGPDATLKVPPHFRVRHDKIDHKGRVTLRYNSRLHHIGLGVALAGTRVVVLAADLNVRVISEDGELLRELKLDPSKDYQPIGSKGGTMS